MKILTVKDVVRLTGFSQSFVYNHYKELMGVKVGGKIFWHEACLEEALRRGNQKVQNQERCAVGVRDSDTRKPPQQKRVPHKARGNGGRNNTPQVLEEKCQRYGIKNFND